MKNFFKKSIIVLSLTTVLSSGAYAARVDKLTSDYLRAASGNPAYTVDSIYKLVTRLFP